MKTKNREKTKLDRQAIIDLYEAHNEALYRYAYRYLSDPDLAEECVSEVFTSFLQRIRDGKPPSGNLRAYLYRIAHNWIVDHYRKRKDESLSLDPMPDPRPNPEKQVSTDEGHEKLRQALLELPEDQRLAVELHIMEDWPHEKVAEFLGKSVEASRALQYRALQNLRKSIVVNRI